MADRIPDATGSIASDVCESEFTLESFPVQSKDVASADMDIDDAVLCTKDTDRIGTPASTDSPGGSTIDEDVETIERDCRAGAIAADVPANDD